VVGFWKNLRFWSAQLEIHHLTRWLSQFARPDGAPAHSHLGPSVDDLQPMSFTQWSPTGHPTWLVVEPSPLKNDGVKVSWEYYSQYMENIFPKIVFHGWKKNQQVRVVDHVAKTHTTHIQFWRVTTWFLVSHWGTSKVNLPALWLYICGAIIVVLQTRTILIPDHGFSQWLFPVFPSILATTMVPSGKLII
jgi:hypothetical protein